MDSEPAKKYIWLLQDVPIFQDKILLLPIKQIGIYTYPKDAENFLNAYTKEYLILVDEDMNKGLHSFLELSTDWKREEWEAFMKSVYPVWLFMFEEIE